MVLYVEDFSQCLSPYHEDGIFVQDRKNKNGCDARRMSGEGKSVTYLVLLEVRSKTVECRNDIKMQC